MDHRPRREPSFEEVAAALRTRALDVCQTLLPGGQRRGHEYVCSDLGGAKARAGDGSLSINLHEGVWRDFATGEGGADLLNLWAAVNKMRPNEARRDAAQWLGLWSEPERGGAQPSAPSAPSADDGVGNADVDEPANWWKGRKADKASEYRTLDGRVYAVIYRYHHPVTGEKIVRPWDPARSLYALPEGGSRPLYALDEIAANRGADVALVEGEKCADALRADGWLATTVMMGAQSLDRTDWSPLAGRHVIAWRDNDQAGEAWLTRLQEIAHEANFASLRTVSIPAARPPGWDAADTDQAERTALLEAARAGRPVVTGKPVLELTDWTAASRAFTGKAPERQWLVRDVIPLGAASVLAAMGGTGKGMLMLDLALKVACDTPGILGPTALGCTVTSFGRAVILSAEDDAGELHRRLEAIDAGGLRTRNGNRLHLVPLPNVGGAFPLVRATARGVETTEEFARLRDQLLAMADLRLVIVDPLAAFVQADLNRDAAAAAHVAQLAAMLAAETNAAVILVHHMRKPSGREGAISGPEQAREAIRGQSAIVDGMRMAYALWPVENAEGKRMAKRLGVEWDRGRMVKGAVVKSNGPADMTVRDYWRDGRGLLVDMTTPVRAIERAEDLTAEAILVEAVRHQANVGRPFSKTGGEDGVWQTRQLLPSPLNDWSKHKLQGLTQILLDKGSIVQARISAKSTVLDVPLGPFAKGYGQIERGSDKPPRHDD